MKSLQELSDTELMQHYRQQQEASLKNIDTLLEEVEAGRIPVDDIDKEMVKLSSRLNEFNIRFRDERERRRKKKQFGMRMLAVAGVLVIAVFIAWKTH